jgi:tetratricopeptide (TPR) repeat protein
VNSARIIKLKEFLEKDPNDNFTNYALGLEYASIKHFEQAIATFEQLRQRDPEYIPTYYQLAGTYREFGQRDKALAIYKEGIIRARNARDLHAASELEAAMDEMADEE